MNLGSQLHSSLVRGGRRALVLLLFVSLVTACGDDTTEQNRSAQNTLSLDVDTVLTDTSYTLVNQDSTAVTFPDNFVGKPVVLGTIYTNCPNVCPKITANMKNIRQKLDDPSAVHFVSVTFDPVRDTPSRLAEYRRKFDLKETSWQFLTGDRETIGALMNRLDVRHTIQDTGREFPTAVDTADAYVFNHSNQITLIDAQGRVRAEYAGSQTPPKLLVNDLEKIQS